QNEIKASVISKCLIINTDVKSVMNEAFNLSFLSEKHSEDERWPALIHKVSHVTSYQFRSWEGHMERMESRQYMPAGPLMDVTVTAGKLNEVHLPHWIYDIPDILDTFAVLHIDDCGDVVEKVSEVTPTHVKLTEPHFSLIGALIRLFFPLKISCYTLMYYKPNTSFLKLHVYPIRQDPALEQVTEQIQSSATHHVQSQ
uniref:FIIND domain-containing protein n=1 Tax=Maylandia zebra TaxID=106582 RepID=A0A3P9DR72_9CICH